MLTSIETIQGESAFSPLHNQKVEVEAVVIAHSRKGFFIQHSDIKPDLKSSIGVFVYSPRFKPEINRWVNVQGIVIDFRKNENDKPTTQIKAQSVTKLVKDIELIEPIWLDDILPHSPNEQAKLLNALEGMLVGVKQGATFIAPSNPFGDYTLAMSNDSTSEHLVASNKGRLINPKQPELWYPSFRVIDYALAPKVNVGASLDVSITGALNYRAQSYQIAVNHPIAETNANIHRAKTALASKNESFTVLTLNGFNLDVKIERQSYVNDPRRDIDDDIGDGRFTLLAKDIVEQADCPDIIALQEIQDNDGAEITQVTDASVTYTCLIKNIQKFRPIDYRWADIPPDINADGGQPGGNIRNGFLYNVNKVKLVEGSLHKIGNQDSSFEGSRKPVMAEFENIFSRKKLMVINVHLASKRHQQGIFSPDNPGYDPREDTRIEQAKLIRQAVQKLSSQNMDYYVTGDFNDNEFSQTLMTLCGDKSVNLVETLLSNQRYDYNHRGKLQVLMHGIVSRKMLEQGRAEYEILHGNELIGVQPGELGDKPSDHAYVMARLS